MVLLGAALDQEGSRGAEGEVRRGARGRSQGGDLEPARPDVRDPDGPAGGVAEGEGPEVERGGADRDVGLHHVGSRPGQSQLAVGRVRVVRVEPQTARVGAGAGGAVDDQQVLDLAWADGEGGAPPEGVLVARALAAVEPLDEEVGRALVPDLHVLAARGLDQDLSEVEGGRLEAEPRAGGVGADPRKREPGSRLVRVVRGDGQAAGVEPLVGRSVGHRHGPGRSRGEGERRRGRPAELPARGGAGADAAHDEVRRPLVPHLCRQADRLPDAGGPEVERGRRQDDVREARSAVRIVLVVEEVAVVVEAAPVRIVRRVLVPAGVQRIPAQADVGPGIVRGRRHLGQHLIRRAVGVAVETDRDPRPDVVLPQPVAARLGLAAGGEAPVIGLDGLVVGPPVAPGAAEPAGAPHDERVVAPGPGMAEVAVRGDRVGPAGVERMERVREPPGEAGMAGGAVPLRVGAGLAVALVGGEPGASDEPIDAEEQDHPAGEACHPHRFLSLPVIGCQ